MKIKITLKQLLSLRDSIITELKSNQKAIIKINSCKTINKEFNRNVLLKLKYIQEELRKDIINIKTYITIANLDTKFDLTKHIEQVFKLSELKEELKCYQNLNMKKGKFKEYGKFVTYSTIISKETANKRIEIIIKEINNIKDKLSVFNNKTIIDIDVNQITFNLASKIIN